MHKRANVMAVIKAEKDPAFIEMQRLHARAPALKVAAALLTNALLATACVESRLSSMGRCDRGSVAGSQVSPAPIPQVYGPTLMIV